MTTNRKRKLREPKSRIPSNMNKEYFESLECRDFLADCTDDTYGDALNEAEAKLLREYVACGKDFDKWRNKKVKNANKPH